MRSSENSVPANFGELDPASEFRRILIPRTSVNKGKGGEGRGHSTMALQVLPVGAGVRFLRLALSWRLTDKR